MTDEIGELTGLTTLDLSQNELTKVPVWIVDLQKLKTLDLSENNLTDKDKKFLSMQKRYKIRF